MMVRLLGNCEGPPRGTTWSALHSGHRIMRVRRSTKPSRQGLRQKVCWHGNSFGCLKRSRHTGHWSRRWTCSAEYVMFSGSDMMHAMTLGCQCWVQRIARMAGRVVNNELQLWVVYNNLESWREDILVLILSYMLIKQLLHLADSPLESESGTPESDSHRRIFREKISQRAWGEWKTLRWSEKENMVVCDVLCLILFQSEYWVHKANISWLNDTEKAGIIKMTQDKWTWDWRLAAGWGSINSSTLANTASKSNAECH